MGKPKRRSGNHTTRCREWEDARACRLITGWERYKSADARGMEERQNERCTMIVVVLPTGGIAWLTVRLRLYLELKGNSEQEESKRYMIMAVWRGSIVSISRKVNCVKN